MNTDEIERFLKPDTVCQINFKLATLVHGRSLHSAGPRSILVIYTTPLYARSRQHRSASLNLLSQPRTYQHCYCLSWFSTSGPLFGITSLIISDLYRLLHCLQIQFKTDLLSGASITGPKQFDLSPRASDST